jgi:hypothetical protein
MPRRLGLVVLLFVAGCGGSSTAPTPTFPPMTGGWGGTYSADWTNVSPEGVVSGSVSCAMTWLISSQDADGSFVGKYEAPATDCGGDAGSVSGTVTMAGAVALALRSTVASEAVCWRDRGDGGFYGAMSGAGALTAQQVVLFNCTLGAETFHQSRIAKVSMNRG